VDCAAVYWSGDETHVKKWLIQLHRRLAIVLWAPFIVWFASGIAMLFGGMPGLRPTDRLRLLEPVPVGKIAVSPMEAARGAAVPGSLESVSVVTVLGRPAYRFNGTATVFADSGERLERVDAAASVRIVASSLRLAPERVHYARMLAAPDQWTVGLGLHSPLHVLTVDDGRGTEAYVSAHTAEVVLTTDRRSRAIGWVSAIPHWFYLTAIRSQERLWRQVVLWTSALGAIVACAGVLVGVVQYRARYAGVKRWHHRAGVLFGPFAVTWIVSGWLSMQPFQWAAPSDLRPRIIDSLSGGGLDVSTFPRLDHDKWLATTGGAGQEIDLIRAFGEPRYVIRDAGAAPMVVSASTLTRRPPFDANAIAARLRTAMRDAPVGASSTLTDYDAYYHDREHSLPLPVARVEFADAQRTIAYIDLATGALVADFTRRQRIERWAYHGLHSLDFPVFDHARLLRTIIVITLCAGGLTLSVLGAAMAVARLRRLR
jgi:hypothetical protein